MAPLPRLCGCGISGTHRTTADKGIHCLQFHADESLLSFKTQTTPLPLPQSSSS